MAIETRHILISSLFLALCALPACNRRAPDLSGYTEEEPPRFAAGLRVADPQAGPQLVSGWYPVEENAWRWTAQKFAVALRPPIGAAKTGAILKLRFTLPEAALSQLRTVTLSASLEGTGLAPETYRTPGNWIYARDVPASSLSAPTVGVQFALDKAFVPGHGDLRELGLIVDRVGLETK